MLVYSKKIVSFIREIKGAIQAILSLEVGLKVGRDRFYDAQKKFSYPLKVVLYNNKSMLGYFDPNFYELGFHESLLYASKQELHNVIRHELAHYITFIQHGETPQPHGTPFRAFCERMGWKEEVYRATTCLEGARTTATIEESSIFRKVQKLLALATSHNQNEAEQAVLKAQQLLLKHNLESPSTEEEEKIFLTRIMKQRRENAKMRAIARILETFFVTVVYNRAGDFIYLEILGNATNIEIATYVAGVLQLELDQLWSQAQQRSPLRGTVAKNSFFLGLAKGYCSKVQALQRSCPSENSHTLLLLEKKLLDAQAMAYPHLSSKKSHGHYCQKSSALGEQMGSQLYIPPAVHKSPNSSEPLLLGSLEKPICQPP